MRRRHRRRQRGSCRGSLPSNIGQIIIPGLRKILFQNINGEEKDNNNIATCHEKTDEKPGFSETKKTEHSQSNKNEGGHFVVYTLSLPTFVEQKMCNFLVQILNGNLLKFNFNLNFYE